MKKIIAIILVLLTLTGCTTIDLETIGENELINSVLYKEIKLYNKNLNGYKLYIPRGLKIIEKNDYNIKILDKNCEYYLYVDIVSFYHNIPVEYQQKNNIYISRKINYGDKTGYLDVSKYNSQSYYVEYYYNFGKIESILPKESLKHALINMTYILSSINYNKVVIDALMSKDILNYKEEKIDIFKAKEGKSNFLEALEKYDVYVEEKEKDQDVVEVEENE